MSVNVRVSGIWKNINEIYANVSGVWKRVSRGWVYENGEWREFFGVPDNMIIFYDFVQTFGILLNGELGEIDLNGRFLRGHTGDGGEIGSATHVTGLSAEFTTGAYASSVNNADDNKGPPANHTHQVPAHAHGAGSSDPPYYDLIPYRRGKIASSIVFFRGNAAPDGWTLFESADGKFLRCNTAAAGGTGGGSTHTHEDSSQNTTGPANTTGMDSFASNVARPHVHTTTHGATGENNPMHVDLRMIKNNGGAAFPIGSVAFFIGETVPFGWHIADGTDGTPNYQGAHVKAASAYSDSLAGSDTHTDTSSATSTGSTTPPESGWVSASSSGSAKTNHSHSMAAHSHGLASSIPLTRKLLICIKTT